MLDLLNKVLYIWRRNNWLYDVGRMFRDLSGEKIRRPIFFLGNQGGGLTLISRMIRRHPVAVSVTGDHNYWSGADEMQRVMVHRLPKELRLSGRILNSDPPHSHFTPPRSWSYASDDLVEDYRLTEEDASEEDAGQFRSLIRESLARHGQGGVVNRFVDKSQVFTLKIRYVDALLKDSQPHFVLITRNPYAACYRAALGKAGDMERYARFMSLDERVKVCAQHWSNAIGYALQDGVEVDHFIHFQFEQILQYPKERIEELCGFLGLDFRPDLLPSPDDTVPLGSRFRDRWYPLRPDVNEKYFDDVSEEHLDYIEERCGELAVRLGYRRPE